MEDSIRSYHWHCGNQYFVLSQADGFGIGGGGTGDFGIWIDRSLLYGTTGRCETFGSPPLLPGVEEYDSDSEAQTRRFEIYSIELWHVCPDT